MKTTRLLQALVVAWLAADTGAFAQSTGTPPADAAKADAKAREDRTAGAPNRDRADERQQRREHRKQVRQRLRHHR